MADQQTIRRAGAGVGALDIDVGLRAHMNRVYGIMGVGMATTGVVAYFTGQNDALLQTLFTGYMRWIVMFAPLVMVFFLGGMINRLSENAARYGIHRVFCADGSVDLLDLRCLHRRFHNANLLHHCNRIWWPVHVRLHHKTRYLWLGQLLDHGCNRINRCINLEYLVGIICDDVCDFCDRSFDLCWLDCIRHAKHQKHLPSNGPRRSN